MTNEMISEHLAFLIQAIIKDWTYPGGQELTLKERQALAAQLQKVANQTNDITEVKMITDAFYKDKVVKHFKSVDTNFSWIFEILQHELVSASRLHQLLLDLAQEEHFSEKGIAKINHYFAESSDLGDNDDFVTLSSSDVIDSLNRAKTFSIDYQDQEQKANSSDDPPAEQDQIDQKKRENRTNNIIRLKDY